jgi:uncharacterized membrane protein
VAHELRNLVGQPRETLAIALVGALVSVVFFAGLFLFFRWRERRRRGAPPVQGAATRQAKQRKRR